MPTQNQNEWNSSQFNYFAPNPKAEIVARQIATPEELAFKDAKKNKKNDGSSGKEGLLVQNSLSEEPVPIGQRNVPNVNVNPVEKKKYSDLYYCASKVVNYLKLHASGQFLPTGDFIQGKINNPKVQAIRSRTNASADLAKVYDMQFYLLDGPTGNKFLEEISEPLPGAVDKQEFIRRMDPATAEVEVSKKLARMGFIDTDFNPLTDDQEALAAPPQRDIIIRDTTPLEKACTDA